jgi:hypothetical protein
MRTISRTIATLALGALVIGSPTAALSPAGSGVAAQGPAASGASPVVVRSDRFALPADADLTQNAQIPVVDLPADPTDLTGSVDPNPALQTLTSRWAGFPPAAWDIQALAATFDGDPDRAFQFVRDSIGFDPYRGVLRGAAGTLIARAGSAADRSLLLAALLTATGATTRFAFADLDAATAARLVARSFAAPTRPIEGPDAATALDPGLLDSIAARAHRDHALLKTALAGVAGTLGTAPADDAIAAVTHHTWVQSQRDGTWVDLDPTMPDAQVGDVPAPAATTSDTIPATEHAAVRIRVLAENLVDGVSQDLVALDQTIDAATASAATTLLSFRPYAASFVPSGGNPPGAHEPVLSVGGTSTVGQPIPVLPSDDPFFGTGSDIRLTRLAIEMTSHAPGRDPIVRERLLLDRIPADVRAAGSWTVDDLMPMPVSQDLPASVVGVHHILVSTGGSDPVAALESSIAGILTASGKLSGDPPPEDLTLGTVLLPLTSTDIQLVLASEHAVVADIDSSVDGRVFIGRPRIFLVSFGPDQQGLEALDLATDLATDTIDIVTPDGDQTAAAAQRLWYGAAETALETEFGLRAARSGDPDGRQLIGTSLAMRQPLSVVTDVAQAAGAPDALLSALTGGAIAIVPGDVAGTRTWWTVMPSDGQTESILAPDGRAFESVFFPLHWGKSWDPIAQEFVSWYDKTVVRAGCGGNEYVGTVDCSSMNALTAQELAYVQRVWLQYMEWLATAAL